MLPKKSFSPKKQTLPAQKQLNKTITAAKKKPYLTLGILAAIPLIILLAFTFKSGFVPSGRPSKKLDKIVVVKTPTEVADEATTALQKKDLETFVELLDKYAKKDVNLVNSKGDPILLVAATIGDEQAVAELLTRGVDVNKTNAFTKDTALLRSLYYDHPAITRQLIYSGADINAKNNYNHSPLFVALEKQNLPLIDLFLTSGAKEGLNNDYLFRAVSKKNAVGVIAMLKGGVDGNIANEKGNTPLIISASLGDVPSVRHLMTYRVDLNTANKDGNTALIYAARYNHPEVIKELLKTQTMQIPLDVNIQNKEGQTALYWGAAKGYTEVVKRLLAAGADPTIADKSGYVPYRIAQKNGRGQVLEWFNKPITEIQNSIIEQDNAALIAQAKAEGKDVSELLGKKEEEKPLVEEDIFNAVEKEDLKLADKVIKEFGRAVVLKKDKSGVAVFLRAVAKGNPKMVDLLIDQGARVFEASPKGNAFHVAISAGNIEMLKHLIATTRASGNLAMMLEYKAPIAGTNLVSAVGTPVPVSPLGLAAHLCNKEIYDYLISIGAKPGSGPNSPAGMYAQCKAKPAQAKTLSPSKGAKPATAKPTQQGTRKSTRQK